MFPIPSSVSSQTGRFQTFLNIAKLFLHSIVSSYWTNIDMLGSCIVRHPGSHCTPNGICFRKLCSGSCHYVLRECTKAFSKTKSKLCCIVFCVKLTAPRITWKERTSTEQLPPSDWPVRDGRCGRAQAQPAVCGAILRQTGKVVQES